MTCIPLIGLLVGGCMQAGTLAPSSDANFTARDRRELANPPYRPASISPAYRRQIVRYHRKEAPGSILVDTRAFFVYYVLPGGKAIRYGATMGEAGQTFSGLATVGRRRNGRVGRRLRIRSAGLDRFRATSQAARAIHWAHAPCTSTLVARTRCTASMAPTSPNTLDKRFPRAASASPTRMRSISTAGCRSARLWWCCQATIVLEPLAACYRVGNFPLLSASK
jgi:hypothetical protein